MNNSFCVRCASKTCRRRSLLIRSAWAALRSGVHAALMCSPILLRSIFSLPASCRRSCFSRHSWSPHRALKVRDFFWRASGLAASREFLARFSGVRVLSIGPSRAARASGESSAHILLRDWLSLARYSGSSHSGFSLMLCFARASAERGLRFLKLCDIRARNSGSAHRRFSLSEWLRRDWLLTARWKEPPCLFSWQFAQSFTRLEGSSVPPWERGIIWCV